MVLYIVISRLAFTVCNAGVQFVLVVHTCASGEILGRPNELVSRAVSGKKSTCFMQKDGFLCHSERGVSVRDQRDEVKFIFCILFFTLLYKCKITNLVFHSQH